MRALILLLLSLPALSADFNERKDGSMVITMSKAEMLDCAKKGGCVIISISDLQEASKNVAAYMCGKNI